MVNILVFPWWTATLPMWQTEALPAEADVSKDNPWCWKKKALWSPALLKSEALKSEIGGGFNFFIHLELLCLEWEPSAVWGYLNIYLTEIQQEKFLFLSYCTSHFSSAQWPLWVYEWFYYCRKIYRTVLITGITTPPDI